MRVKLQLVVCHDEGHEETVTDVITLNKNNQRVEHLGLSLAESKQLLSTLQRQLLQQQVNTFLDTHSMCPDCRTPLHLKARGSRSFRTLFGTFKFYSPRLEYCDCKRRKTASFRPLSALLTEPVAPELLYISIIKFFQVDITGMFRITSFARYFNKGVGSSRPSWRWIMCFLERLNANTSCKAWLKRFS
jgi:hypothetical protein